MFLHRWSNFNTHKTCWKCCINNERPTGQKNTTAGTTVENKGKLILITLIFNSYRISGLHWIQHHLKTGQIVLFPSSLKAVGYWTSCDYVIDYDRLLFSRIPNIDEVHIKGFKCIVSKLIIATIVFFFIFLFQTEYSEVVNRMHWSINAMLGNVKNYN